MLPQIIPMPWIYVFFFVFFVFFCVYVRFSFMYTSYGKVENKVIKINYVEICW